MEQLLVKLATRVIERADRERPADAVLRGELKFQRQLAPEQARSLSLGVFAYYRWLGWLDTNEPLGRQLARAAELDARFAREPGSFTDAELLDKAVPAWVRAGQFEILGGTEDREATARAWVRALQHVPKVWLRTRKGQGGEVARQLRNCQPAGTGPLADALEYRGGEDLFRTEEFHAGAFELQDLSSQAVGWVCQPQPGETWWDACAGEGGKTLHLSSLMDNRGLIWASDRAAWRLAKLKRRTARAQVFNYRAKPWDGSATLPTKTRFDGVLVDAPCANLGTWQRNPHARWTTTPEDIRELSQVQRALLRHAAAAVKPGGKLVYAVCTLTRAETVEVAEAFEQELPQFSRLALANPLQPGSTPAPQLWLWPQDWGGNGMFVTAWKRE